MYGDDTKPPAPPTDRPTHLEGRRGTLPPERVPRFEVAVEPGGDDGPLRSVDRRGIHERGGVSEICRFAWHAQRTPSWMSPGLIAHHATPRDSDISDYPPVPERASGNAVRATQRSASNQRAWIDKPNLYIRIKPVDVAR